jgi:peptidoglycan/LPS O-acetylase OafA/YrhL
MVALLHTVMDQHPEDDLWQLQPAYGGGQGIVLPPPCSGMSAVANPAQALHKPTQAKSKYRPEIDGLRAFAVVAVIINHFNKDLLPSGYLGVDIFFVISGYVITSSLADRQSKNFLDFLTGFYERRIKRLVPALVVFVLITSVLISLFNPDPGVALKTGITSLFGLSNIYLFKTSTDYFAQSTELNPFTHTWSLGVEEQFYLLFPFLIWFSGFGQQTTKGARNLFFWVGALTLASLIGFIYLYQVNQPAAYFLMPPRFWEMAAGCLIFIGFQKRVRIEQALEQVPPLLVVATMVGVMFLPVSAAVPATFGVVVLSAILIACLKKGTAAYQFFTLEKVVYVGLISYSLYLWHWTVLSISRWTIGIHWWSTPAQIVVILIFSLCSYHWVEVPTRKGALLSTRMLTIALGMAATSTIAAAIFASSRGLIKIPYSGIIDDSNRPLMGFKDQHLRIGSKHCHSTNSDQINLDLALRNCSRENPRNSQLLTLIGDSHALAILPSAVYAAKREGYSFFYYSKDGCALLVDPSNRSNCLDSREEILRSIQKMSLQRKKTIILLASRFVQADRKNSSHIANLRKQIEEILSFLNGSKIELIYMAPIPEFDEFIGSMRCKEQWFSPRNIKPKTCNASVSRAEVQSNRKELMSVLFDLARKNPSLRIYDPIDALCNKESCHPYEDGKFVYHDDDHLSAYSAKWVGPDITRFLKQ